MVGQCCFFPPRATFEGPTHSSESMSLDDVVGDWTLSAIFVVVGLLKDHPCKTLLACCLRGRFVGWISWVLVKI